MAGSRELVTCTFSSFRPHIVRSFSRVVCDTTVFHVCFCASIRRFIVLRVLGGIRTLTVQLLGLMPLPFGLQGRGRLFPTRPADVRDVSHT